MTNTPKLPLIIVALVFLLGAGWVGVEVWKNISSLAAAPTPTPVASATPAPAEPTPCGPMQLAGRVQFEGAAGSVYGIFSLRNIGMADCVLTGLSTPQLEIDPAITNVTTTSDTPVSTQSYQLAVGQSLYAQVRMPNGPQCNSSPKNIDVKYYFSLSDEKKIYFEDVTGEKESPLTACSDKADMTQVQFNSWTTSMPQ